MGNIQTLYHGTTKLFNYIDLSKGDGFKDFGPGFYASGNKQRAIKLARRNRDGELDFMHKNKIKGTVLAYCYELEFDTSVLSNNDLNIKIFKKADIEWLEFILFNRQSKFKIHPYDIVIGPTADDKAATIVRALGRYHKGRFSEQQLEVLLKEFKPSVYPKQYYFGTYQALQYVRLCQNRRITL